MGGGEGGMGGGGGGDGGEGGGGDGEVKKGRLQEIKSGFAARPSARNVKERSFDALCRANVATPNADPMDAAPLTVAT